MIFDQSGALVYGVAAAAGETRTAPSVLLPPGEYDVRIAAGVPSGELLPALSYELFGKVVSDAIGPGVTDPTETPLYTCSDTLDAYCYPTDTTTTDMYLWELAPDTTTETTVDAWVDTYDWQMDVILLDWDVWYDEYLLLP